MIGPVKLAELDGKSRAEICERNKGFTADAEVAVRTILTDVRRRGLAAVLEYERRFDCPTLKSIKVSSDEIQTAQGQLAKALRSVIIKAAKRIEAFQRLQLPREFRRTTKEGELGQKVVPLERAGVYAPGGTARYPSSVLMGCIPARVAGVKEIVLCTPPDSNGNVSAEVLFAAKVAGATEVCKIGGAQAIAAMAYGVDGLNRVGKIVGPGNKYVTSAKALVRNDCSIDFLAGPSEILVVADGTAKADLVALELVAQLEHDTDAQAILVTTSGGLANDVATILPGMANSMPRAETILRAMDRGCAIIVAGSMDEALEFANEYAPEHLILTIVDSDKALKKVRNAGSIFLGSESAVAFGDYCAGPDHILPTMGNARTAGALSPCDFVKLVPYQRFTVEGAMTLAPIAAAMARAEGLEAHARSAESRGDER